MAGMATYLEVRLGEEQAVAAAQVLWEIMDLLIPEERVELGQTLVLVEPV